LQEIFAYPRYVFRQGNINETKLAFDLTLLISVANKMSSKSIYELSQRKGSAAVDVKYASGDKTLITEQIKQQLQGVRLSNLERVVAFTNAHYSRTEGVMKGVAFVMRPTMLSKSILGQYRDMCGSVAVYEIAKFDRSDCETAINDFAAKMQTKPFFADTSIYTIGPGVKDIAIGALNCSIGVYKSVVKSERNGEEDAHIVWHIVVRTYYAAGSEDLIRSLENVTISNLYESEMYKSLIRTSDKIRNSIAATYAESIGATLTEPVTTEKIFDKPYKVATPLAVNRYNVIQRFWSVTNEQRYVFYAGCYGFAEESPRVIIMGRGRARGYDLLGYGSKSLGTIGTSESAFGFPMGVPVNGGLEASPVSEVIAHKHKGVLHWSGKCVRHPKVDASLYVSDYFDNELGLATIRDIMGGSDLPRLKLMPKSVYITSPSELDMSIEDLLAYHKGEKTLPVPKSNTFLDTYLMPGYRAIQANERNIKICGDIIVQETEFYTILSRQRVEQILDVVNTRVSDVVEELEEAVEDLEL